MFKELFTEAQRVEAHLIIKGISRDYNIQDEIEKLLGDAGIDYEIGQRGSDMDYEFLSKEDANKADQIIGKVYPDLRTKVEKPKSRKK